MRVTNGMILNNYMNNLYDNLEQLSDLSNQEATGKRITKLSDDPIGVISSLQARTKLNQIEQYEENIDSANTLLSQAETAMLELNEVVQSVYETTVQLANGYITGDDKSAAAEEIAQLRDHVLQIANTKSGDKYIFGGYNVSTEPFTIDSTGGILYNGLDLTNDSDPALIAEGEQVAEYEIGLNMKTEASLAGTSVLGMGDDNIYTVLDELVTALENDASADDISEFITRLQDNQSNITAVEAEIGGRMNRLELVKNRYEDDFLSYTELKSNIEDADLAEVAMNYSMAEAVYTASLQIGQRIIQQSLVNYLD